MKYPAILYRENNAKWMIFLYQFSGDRDTWPTRIKTSGLWRPSQNPVDQVHPVHNLWIPGYELRNENGTRVTQEQIAGWVPLLSPLDVKAWIEITVVFSDTNPAFIEQLKPRAK